jgi:hypothetical protein
VIAFCLCALSGVGGALIGELVAFIRRVVAASRVLVAKATDL